MLGGNATLLNMLGALLLLRVLGSLEAKHLQIVGRTQIRNHAVAIQIHRDRLIVDFTVAIEVDGAVGGLVLI